MELIWDELGTKFKELFGMGRSGVVASVIATSQRLQSHETEVRKQNSSEVACIHVYIYTLILKFNTKTC